MPLSKYSCSVIANAPELKPYVVGLCSSKRNLKRPAVQAMWQLASKLEPKG
jgi:LysR family positive regulator for ilvC